MNGRCRSKLGHGYLMETVPVEHLSAGARAKRIAPHAWRLRAGPARRRVITPAVGADVVGIHQPRLPPIHSFCSLGVLRDCIAWVMHEQPFITLGEAP
jgi:hypothetical protein